MKNLKWHAFLLLLSWTLANVNPAHSSGENGNGVPQDHCIRFRFGKAMTSRQAQAWFCAMAAPKNEDTVTYTLECMQKQGIYITDDDIKEVVLILPYEKCIKDIVETVENEEEEAMFFTDLENDPFENITDAVLCMRMYRNGDDVPVMEDMCLVRSEGDILSLRQKQNRGNQLSDLDQDTLREHYFQYCSSDYEAMYRQNSITLDFLLVSSPNQCDSFVKQKIVSLMEAGESEKVFQIIGYTITVIGILGSLLSLSVFCRPSFLARHHVGYLCIIRSIFDIFMLVYCALSGFIERETDFTLIAETQDAKETFSPSKYGLLQCCSFYIFFMSSEIGVMLITLALSVQRLLAVAIPLKAKVYLNKRVAKKLCVIVVCMCVVIPAICFVMIYIATDFNPSCYITDAHTDFMFHFLIVWSTLFITLPWLTIILITSLTIYYVVISRKKRNELTEMNPNATSQQIEFQKDDFTMIIVVGIGFLIVLVPEMLLNALALVGQNIDLMLSALYIQIATYISLSVKSSLNFFIYFVTNPKFREIIISCVKRTSET